MKRTMLALLLALSACGDDVATAPDAAERAADAAIDTPGDAQVESRGCMGNLPNSRTITINTGDPIPPALLNEMQDMIVGQKFKSTNIPIAASAFFCESGSGTYANGLWSGATSGSVKLVYGMMVPDGTIISNVVIFFGPAGSLTFALERQTMVDGGVTSESNSASEGPVGSWGSAGLAIDGSGSLTLPHTVDFNYQYLVTVTLASHTPPLKFSGAVLVVSR